MRLARVDVFESDLDPCSGCRRAEDGSDLSIRSWGSGLRDVDHPDHVCSVLRETWSDFTNSEKSDQVSFCFWTIGRPRRSEEHTSELQSQSNLVCRLLLEKKKK